jgi:HTH-type transcriptional regulator / antitoxin HigA
MILTINREVYGSLLVEFQPQVITTEEQNEQALELVERLMAIKGRTSEQNQILQLLVLLIEKFEEEHYPLDASTPHSRLLHLMEARNLRQSDLVGVIGSKGVTSEVVRGKRAISKNQAKALAEFFHVAPGLFV